MTYIITSQKCSKNLGINNEIIKCNKNKDGYIDLKDLLFQLESRGINKLMVEGGGTVIWNFIKNGFFDDLFVYTAPFVIGGKNTPTMADGSGMEDEKSKILLKIIKIKQLGEGFLIHYRKK